MCVLFILISWGKMATLPHTLKNAFFVTAFSILGRGQVVRHRFLVSCIVGSNPTAPANPFIFRRDNSSNKANLNVY